MNLRYDGMHIFELDITEEEKASIIDKYIPQPMETDADNCSNANALYPHAVDSQILDYISNLHSQYDEYQRILIKYTREVENLQKNLN